MHCKNIAFVFYMNKIILPTSSNVPVQLAKKPKRIITLQPNIPGFILLILAAATGLEINHTTVYNSIHMTFDAVKVALMLLSFNFMPSSLGKCYAISLLEMTQREFCFSPMWKRFSLSRRVYTMP